ncbi:hypothetical protein FIBSPDRAFT_816936 [Athelia psychrophila]|uniref:BTB domain-containing protein n=1 Tax=Athelia psychrophila TaxID=1759441 RepID=A0A166RRV1_9AGAM|nr:hypothetical protein FIBSPDRAFT_816936 [Fibularhizoctonia sp. CBS 109695]
MKYSIGDTILYKIQPLTDFTLSNQHRADAYGTLFAQGPGVIVELFETLDAGATAKIHQFKGVQSQHDEVLYCFEDTALIPIHHIIEHCTIYSAPQPSEPTSGPRYHCSYAIYMHECFWQTFDWESHREKALSRRSQGLSSNELWNVVKKPGDHVQTGMTDLPKVTHITNVDDGKTVDPKRLDAEIWLESLSKDSQAAGSPSQTNNHAVSFEATAIDTALLAPDSRRYDPAFADPEATVVLTSFDDVSYRMHPVILRTSSNLPPIDADLDEYSDVLGRLLRMISGLGAGNWKTLEDVEEVLAAVHKYGMTGPILDIRCTVLSSFFVEQPLRAFVVAARYGWEDEAKLASKHTLQISIHDEQHALLLEQTPSNYLTRLLRLHRTRRDKFRAHISRDNRCFGVEACPCCQESHSQENAPALRNLMNSMVWEMDRQPAGLDLISGQWKEWPAYEARQLCPKFPGSNVKEAEYEQRIMQDLKAGIECLPSTI